MIRATVSVLMVGVAVCTAWGPCEAQDTRLLGQSVQVDLFSDGSRQTTWQIRSLNTSDHPLRVFSFRSSTNTLEKVLDAGGNELRVETDRRGPSFQFTVYLTEPVPPGEEFILTKQDRKSQLMRGAGDQWVFDMNHTPGPATEYTLTVRLPARAEIISAVPSPTRQFEEDDLTILVYERHLGTQEAFRCQVRYIGLTSERESPVLASGRLGTPMEPGKDEDNHE